MAQYKTGQKECLIAYLAENSKRQFRMEELVSALDGQVGKSTVYRLVRTLVDEGRVRRFGLGAGREVYYQYLPGAACDSHLHMKCTVCGRMQHLDCSVSTFLQKQIMATDRFELDDRLTLLLGRCSRCQTKTPTHTERN